MLLQYALRKTISSKTNLFFIKNNPRTSQPLFLESCIAQKHFGMHLLTSEHEIEFPGRKKRGICFYLTTLMDIVIRAE